MVRSLYVSVLLAIAIAGHTEAAATGTNAMARRQLFGASHGFPFGSGVPTANNAGFSSSTTTHTESHSSATVMETYNGLLGDIQSCRNAFGQNGFTTEAASQQIHQVATRFQTAFAQLNACESCISNNQMIQFRETFSKLFSSFHSLFETARERYPNQWQPLFDGSFRNLNQGFQQFFSTCQRGGLEVHQFVPQELTPFFQHVGMNSVFSGYQGSSSSSSSSFHSESSIHTERQSVQGVMSAYNDLLTRVKTCQGEFAQNGFTTESATQHIQQLATQFQRVFSQFDGCSACASQEIQNFRGVFSDLFTSFNGFVETCQERFPNHWQDFFGGHFGGLNDEFSRFFSTCQRGGLEVHQFVPQQLNPFFQHVGMNSAFSSLQQSGFSSSSSFHSESSIHNERHSVQGVMSAYNDLLTRVKTCQGEFAREGFTSESATQHIQQLTTQFQRAFSQFDGCSACSNQEIQNFRGVFSDLFTSFHGFVETCQERFPNHWQGFFGRSFGSLNEDFSRFFSSCQRGGLPVNTFFPQQLGHFFNKVEMTSAASTLKQVGYSF